MEPHRVARIAMIAAAYAACTLVAMLFLGWMAWGPIQFRISEAIAVLGPVIANALIVPAYLPFMLQGLGFYTIPFTSINLDGMYWAMYALGFVATGLGEAAVMYCLGLPVYHAIANSPLPAQLAQAEASVEGSMGEDGAR